MAQDVVVRVSKIPQIETPLLTPSRFFLDPYEPAFSSRGRCIFQAITSGLGLPLGTHNMVSCSPQTTRLPSKRRPETPGSPLSQCWAQRCQPRASRARWEGKAGRLAPRTRGRKAGGRSTCIRRWVLFISLLKSFWVLNCVEFLWWLPHGDEQKPLELAPDKISQSLRRPKPKPELAVGEVSKFLNNCFLKKFQIFHILLFLSR